MTPFDIHRMASIANRAGNVRTAEMLDALADVVEAAENLMRLEDNVVTSLAIQRAEQLADSLGAVRRLQP